MKKTNVINFIESIEDCEEIEKIYIEQGIKEDYIKVSYCDNNKIYKNKATIYKK